MDDDLGLGFLSGSSDGGGGGRGGPADGFSMASGDRGGFVNDTHRDMVTSAQEAQNQFRYPALSSRGDDRVAELPRHIPTNIPTFPPPQQSSGGEEDDEEVREALAAAGMTGGGGTSPDAAAALMFDGDDDETVRQVAEQYNSAAAQKRHHNAIVDRGEDEDGDYDRKQFPPPSPRRRPSARREDEDDDMQSYGSATEYSSSSSVIDDLQLSIVVVLLYIALELVPVDACLDRWAPVCARLPYGGILYKAVVAGVVVFLIKAYFFKTTLTRTTGSGGNSAHPSRYP